MKAVTLSVCILMSAGTLASQPLADLKLYRAFFQQIADNAKPHTVVRAFGDRIYDVERPRLQDVIGLNDTEVAALTNTAADCMKKLDLANKPQAVVFEARLEQIQNGEVSGANAVALTKIEEEITEIVQTHIQSLKSELGADSFAKLNDFVRSERNPRALMGTLIPHVEH